MNDEDAVLKPHVFAMYAGTDLAKWEAAIGRKVQHSIYGTGIVAKIVDRGAGNLDIAMVFGQLHKVLTRQTFGESKCMRDMDLPAGLPDLGPYNKRVRQQALERRRSEKQERTADRLRDIELQRQEIAERQK